MDKNTIKITKENKKISLIHLSSVIHDLLTITDKPVTVTIQEYKANRSVESNKLQRKWIKELEAQGDMTQEEYRGYCKLHFGIAIAKENDEFAEKYNRLLKHRTYAEKLEFMMIPMDMPVTRIFDTKQMHRYLNQIYEYYSGMGYALTLPVDKYWDSVFTQGDRL